MANIFLLAQAMYLPLSQMDILRSWATLNGCEAAGPSVDLAADVSEEGPFSTEVLVDEEAEDATEDREPVASFWSDPDTERPSPVAPLVGTVNV
jgi:hypothetical protein